MTDTASIVPTRHSAPPAAPLAAPLAASPAAPMIAIEGLGKTYASGFTALRNVTLAVPRGEIFALLGPNGAGKTTLISIVCGLTRASAGSVRVGGHDVVRDYRAARSLIGLVPQELTTDAFETVFATVSFSRGLFGKPPNPALVERVLRDLSLWDKKDSRILTLSGGMKRRVMIAKALSHEPAVLFLDEPTAGVDVELRHDMWRVVRRLADSGVTVILTTHYLEEAEQMADRIGVINRGELMLVEEKAALIRRLGSKRLTIHLAAPIAAIPDTLAGHGLIRSADGASLVHVYAGDHPDIGTLLADIAAAGLRISDLETQQSSLEDIFVDLVGGRS